MNESLDLSHHFSTTTKRLIASDVKKFYKYFAIPGIRNLAGGMPNVSFFPFETLEAQVTAPDGIGSGTKFVIPRESPTVDAAQKIDITTALQYGTAEGYPALHAFVREFTRQYLHPNVPYMGGPEVLLTCGATDGFSKVIELLTDIWDHHKQDDDLGTRQAVLCEEFTYMNAVQTARPRGVNLVPISVDKYGMQANGIGGLAEVLDNWDSARGKPPRLMYTITTGQNPTGTVMPMERKKEIYALCQKHDIIICEDEPYWHLQYMSSCNENNYWRKPNFWDTLVPSYLSIDVDGRVIRLDTFSKTVAPGCRLGWITAQPKIIERLTRITEVSTAQPSGFAQAMVAKMIVDKGKSKEMNLTSKCTDEPWGMSGWIEWLETLCGKYERRMQTMCQILEEGSEIIAEENEALAEDCDWSTISKTRIYEFNYPRGGMFVWIRILIESHPLYWKVDEDRLMAALSVFLSRKPYLALVAPGAMFNPLQHSDENQYPDINGSQANRHVRLSFAALPEKDVAAASHGVVEGAHAFWNITDVEQIDKILEDEETLVGIQSYLALGC